MAGLESSSLTWDFGAARARPRLGAFFFISRTNSLTAASSLVVYTTAQSLQEGRVTREQENRRDATHVHSVAEKQFHFLKARLQSASSSL